MVGNDCKSNNCVDGSCCCANSCSDHASCATGSCMCNSTTCCACYYKISKTNECLRIKTMGCACQANKECTSRVKMGALCYCCSQADCGNSFQEQQNYHHHYYRHHIDKRCRKDRFHDTKEDGYYFLNDYSSQSVLNNTIYFLPWYTRYTRYNGVYFLFFSDANFCAARKLPAVCATLAVISTKKLGSINLCSNPITFGK